MTLHRATADSLNDRLDAIVTGQGGSPSDLDPALAAAVERFFAADDAPAPPPDLANRLWIDLLPQSQEEDRPAARLLSRREGNGHDPLRALPAPPAPGGASRPRRALSHFATAALVLLTLVGAFVAIRSPLGLVGQQERPASIPAIDGAPEATVVMEALITDWQESGPLLWAGLHRVTFDPGAVEDATGATGVGPVLLIVESGQLAVEADGPILVTRGPAALGAEPATVPAGTTIVLAAGDQLFGRSGVSLRRRNDGAAPAVILDFRITDLEQLHRSGSVHYRRLMPDKVINAALPAPAEVAVRRLRLLPGRSLPLRDLPGLQMLYVEAGTLDLMGARRLGDLLPVSWDALLAGESMAHFETTLEMANRNAEPVTVLVVTIERAE